MLHLAHRLAHSKILLRFMAADRVSVERAVASAGERRAYSGSLLTTVTCFFVVTADMMGAASAGLARLYGSRTKPGRYLGTAFRSPPQSREVGSLFRVRVAPPLACAAVVWVGV